MVSSGYSSSTNEKCTVVVGPVVAANSTVVVLFSTLSSSLPLGEETLTSTVLVPPWLQNVGSVTMSVSNWANDPAQDWVWVAPPLMAYSNMQLVKVFVPVLVRVTSRLMGCTPHTNPSGAPVRFTLASFSKLMAPSGYPSHTNDPVPVGSRYSESPKPQLTSKRPYQSG